MPQTTLPNHYRRNFWCLVSDFGFFGIASTLISPTTVVPSFLSALGASTAVIGLVSSLQTAGGMVPQLVAARYLADKPLKKPYVLWPAAIGRSLYLLLALVLWATGGQPAWLIVLLTALAVTGFWVANALASVPWLDLVGKLIPADRRGQMFGTSQAMSGIAGFFAGILVEWMLGSRGPTFPASYVWLFLLAFGLFAVSFAAVSMIAEDRRAPASAVPSWREYIPQLWNVLKRDRAFRMYTIARQLFALGGLATPFYMTYALTELGLPPQVAGRYASIGVVGSVLASVTFARVSGRYGCRAVVQISVGLAAATPLVALVIPRLLGGPTQLAWGYGLVFLCLRAVMSSTMPGWMTFVLELAPAAERPIYVGLTNTLSGLTAVFATIGGLILQWTGNNYEALFVITSVGVLLAALFVFRVADPRQGYAHRR